MTEAMPDWQELTSLLGQGTVRRLVKHGKVKVNEVAILWVTFIITILETKKRVLFGTFRSIFQLFWTKIMEAKVILRIISKTFIY